ncbi:MAG: hypothetical protein LPK19_00995 [Hymenobacteraceae bacterium]|nr:hypothetical protein [Hymenobacteraceae bacterium]MDX5394746.1 hypothetical protein [Hymenobacteraceae bacterium]MDX5510779.1 hypothetical protein [Hymenobacteraceae bacterium]
MNGVFYYLKLFLPNVLFLGVFLFLYDNRELLSANTTPATWAAYSVAVFVLISISLFVNRWHQVKITYTEQEDVLKRLKQVFDDQGFQLKKATSKYAVYNKAFLVHSFLTPGIKVTLFKDYILLDGPKAKLSDIVELLEERGYEGVTIHDPAIA